MNKKNKKTEKLCTYIVESRTKEPNSITNHYFTTLEEAVEEFKKHDAKGEYCSLYNLK